MGEGMLRRWLEPEPVEPPEALRAAVGGHPLVAQILARRGLSDPGAALAFLNPDAYTPAPPEDLPGMLEACRRIERAIQAGETICVWGDFDVDGQTSTTLLVETLRALEARVVYHIPVRSRESHGVNIEHLAPILDGGASLLLTCDTGISDEAALAYAGTRGVDVIVTDHHSLPERLPPAYATITPRLLPENHPLRGLPGVGVAYQLAEALLARAGKDSTPLLDLAALGIVADLAEQTADTRYLLQRGLAVLRRAQRTGLAVMYELAALQAAFLTEEHIGFVLGPRLNALGRLDDANPAVELLTTTGEGRARVLATHLEGLNARRRLLTGQVLRGALAQIEKEPELLEQSALVLSHPEWPAGVIGIVASELSERYNRPTLLLSTPPGQPARGSARSVEGVNITAAIAGQQRLLNSFGGHPMAAGLSLPAENIPALRRGLSRAVDQALGGAAPRRSLALDGALDLSELTLDLVADLERLAPFGPGNPALALVIPRLTILTTSAIGREGDHLQIVVKDARDQTRRVVWWRGAGWPLPEGMFDLACVVRASNFRGQRDVQVEWIDARPVDNEAVELRSKILPAIDQRSLEHPLPVLQAILAESPSAVVWAEGEAGEKLAGVGVPSAVRDSLSPADTLILWTTPPGRAEVQAVIERVQPQAVVVFAVDPPDTAADAFLRRLAGMARYAIEHMDGQAALSRLACATAQREMAVRLGLEWLCARGTLSAETSTEGMVTLKAGGQADLPRAEGIYRRLRTLLEETAAYRRYFHTAEKDYLV